MSLLEFIRLLLNWLRLLVVFPIVLAVLVGLLTWNTPNSYSSSTLIHTGLVSGLSIADSEKRSLDYLAINNAFDNLINIVESRQTREEVSVRLMVHNLQQNDPQPITQTADDFEELEQLVPVVLTGNTERMHNTEELVRYLMGAKDESNSNPVRLLLDSPRGFYSTDIIGRVSVSRVSNSDMIELSYTSSDPAICQKTLEILVDVVVRKQTEMKKAESGEVLAYFIRQTQKALETLRQNEVALREFKREHRIINYYEQTKYISAQKKDLDIEYQKEQMALAAAKRGLSELGQKMAIHTKIYERNETIKQKKDLLAELGSQIAVLSASSANPPLLLDLQQEHRQLKEELRADLEAAFQLNHSTEGLNRSKVLDEWLDHFLLVDQYKARTKVLAQRRRNFDRQLDLFAPLGSTLSRLEREVHLAEQSYLAMLNSQNESKLRQQNIELGANLKVIDPPYYPLEPEPAKRGLLIVLGLVGGFVLCVALVVAVEYLDHSLKAPKRAEKATGLELMGVFPKLDNQGKINTQFLVDQLVERAITKLQQYLPETKTSEQPHLVLIFSCEPREGKSSVGRHLAAKLCRLGHWSWFLHPTDPEEQEASYSLWERNYEPPANLYDVENVEDLLGPNTPQGSGAEFVIVEFPALMIGQIPLKLVSKASISLLVLSANRIWRDADAAILDSLKKAAKGPLLPYLNGVKPTYLEPIIGEVEKPRTRLRILAKRIARFEFGL